MAQQAQSKDRLADYIPVAERIEQFYDKYPEGRIVTHIVEHDADKGFILMRAEGYRGLDDALPSATGHAFELRSEGYVNKTSYIENCETGCTGRMLANLGFETKRNGEGRTDKQPPPSDRWGCGEQRQKTLQPLIKELEVAGIKRAALGDIFEKHSGQRDPKLIEAGDADKVILELRELQRMQRR